MKAIGEKEKAEIIDAMKGLIAQGWSVCGAYGQVKAARQSEGSIMPSGETVRRWMKSEIPVPASAQAAQAAQEGGEVPEDVTEDGESAESAAAGTEDAQGDDYTRRLRMMVRLYRFRQESDIDAICDELLPDLAGE